MTIPKFFRLIAVILAAALFAAHEQPVRAQLFARPAAKPITIEVLDIGQGDSILIRSPEGKTALIDAGPTRTRPRLPSSTPESTSLDMVAIIRRDHYGGMDEAVKVMKPATSWRAGPGTSTSIPLLKTVQAQGTTVVQPSTKARKIELGSAELTIFPQPPEQSKKGVGNVTTILKGNARFSKRIDGY